MWKYDENNAIVVSHVLVINTRYNIWPSFFYQTSFLTTITHSVIFFYILQLHAPAVVVSGNSSKEVFLKISQIYQENTRKKLLCWSFFFKKMAGRRLKKKLQYKFFPVKFAKFLRAPFLKKHRWWLLLTLWFTESYIPLIITLWEN